MKGLEIKFECPNCGNILKVCYPADSVSMLRRNLVGGGDLKCSCGRVVSVRNMRILGFGTVEFEIKKEEE